MLTGTLLKIDDFQGRQLDKATARLFVKGLEKNAVVFISRDDLLKFEEVLPSQEFAYLKDGIIKGRIVSRLIREESKVMHNFEVRISVEGEVSEPAIFPASIVDYEENVLVKSRYEIREGNHKPGSREEFWDLVILPMLRALTPSRSTVDFVDSYMIHDALRSARRLPEDQVGLYWLVTAITQFVDQWDLHITMRFFTGLARMDDSVDLRSARAFFLQLRSHISPRVKCEVFIVPPLPPDAVRNEMHDRRVVSLTRSGSMILGLDRGFSDLDGSECPRAWNKSSYFPHSPEGAPRHLVRNTENFVPKSHRFMI